MSIKLKGRFAFFPFILHDKALLLCGGGGTPDWSIKRWQHDKDTHSIKIRHAGMTHVLQTSSTCESNTQQHHL